MATNRLGGIGAVIFLAVVLVGIYINQKPKSVVPQEFAIQVAEANRQADVASQLRAAERGDLLELHDGHYRLVRANHDGGIYLSSCLSDEKGFKISQLSAFVKRVYKQESPTFVSAAKIYLRCDVIS